MTNSGTPGDFIKMYTSSTYSPTHSSGDDDQIYTVTPDPYSHCNTITAVEDCYTKLFQKLEAKISQCKQKKQKAQTAIDHNDHLVNSNRKKHNDSIKECESIRIEFDNVQMRKDQSIYEIKELQKQVIKDEQRMANLQLTLQKKANLQLTLQKAVDESKQWKLNLEWTGQRITAECDQEIAKHTEASSILLAQSLRAQYKIKDIVTAHNDNNNTKKKPRKMAANNSKKNRANSQQIASSHNNAQSSYLSALNDGHNNNNNNNGSHCMLYLYFFNDTKFMYHQNIFFL